jgi:hypothetical protein
VYGHEAKISYNPQKRGRPSFYPLFCFESHTKDSWHAKFRSGKELRDFIEQCFVKLPPYIYRIRAREDTEFFKREVKESRLCDSNTITSVQKSPWWFRIPRIQKGLVECRVLSSTRKMEEEISVYCYSPTSSRKTRSTTYTFYPEEICLSGANNLFHLCQKVFIGFISVVAPKRHMESKS